MKTNIYIDGFNLYYGCIKDTPYHWLNVAEMCRLLLPKDKIHRIKYFTALVTPRPNDLEKPLRQKTFLRALQTIPHLEIILGSFLSHEVMMPRSPIGSGYVKVIKTEEKGSDVNIATKMILEYGIHDAQAEAPPIIKNIVVYQPTLSSVELTYTNPETGEKRTVDEMDEEFKKIENGLSSTQWVTDPDPMRKQIRIALDRLKEQDRRATTLANGSYKPILFVVAITIKDAEQARDMLEKEFQVRTLLVTEQSEDSEREEARMLGKIGSPYQAVVSVLMLREGWDVPAVSVILLLRKFSSRVYGQQVVGRGLRLNIRGEDIQEICAIVDHKKLSHDWLWDMVGAKVRENVEQLSMFGDEDLPPKRKPQIVAHPELLIEIPKPIEEEKSDFEDDLANIVVETGDYPNWHKILDNFDYAVETEITRVEIESVQGKILDGSGFKEISEAPAGYSTHKPPEEIHDPTELGDRLKNSIRDIASNLLAEEGIGSHELGYLYGVLMSNVGKKMLNGKTVGTASVEELRHALNRIHQMSSAIKSKPGLLNSIVTYKVEG